MIYLYYKTLDYLQPRGKGKKKRQKKSYHTKVNKLELKSDYELHIMCFGSETFSPKKVFPKQT